jgi:hypothetical protein
MAPDAWAGMPGKNNGYQISINQQTFIKAWIMEVMGPR